MFDEHDPDYRAHYERRLARIIARAKYLLAHGGASLPDLRDKLIQVRWAAPLDRGNIAVQRLVSSYGVQKISDLTPRECAAIMAEAEVLIEEFKEYGPFLEELTRKARLAQRQALREKRKMGLAERIQDVTDSRGPL